ncbi:MAG: saccharopine dehydrogenase, partial [Solirubrobacteraceae bacterium]
VHAHPFLPHELERVAAMLGLRTAEWWTVFDGDRVQATLGRRGGVAELIAAADLDTFGCDPYQRFVLWLRGAEGAATLRLSGREPIELTGDMAAVTVAAVLGGEAPGGLGYAGEVLPLRGTLDALRSCDSVESLAVSTVAGAAHDDRLLVEGVL